MEKLINIINLDNTIAEIDVEPWIILKNKPNEFIIRLKKGERSLIESGVFRNDDILIDFNGKKYWISNDMYSDIERKTKKDINLADLGISYAEFFDEELVSEQSKKITLISDVVDNLKNTNDKTIIVSNRSDLDLHSDLIGELRNKLKEYNIIIDNIYFLSKNNTQTYLEDFPLKKSLLVLEKMVGYKIIDNKFSNIQVDQYNKVNYYDNDRETIEELKTLQETFNKIYYNSEDNIKSIIIHKVLNSKPFIKTFYSTGNDFNKFENNSLILNRPTRIHKFNFFK